MFCHGPPCLLSRCCPSVSRMPFLHPVSFHSDPAAAPNIADGGVDATAAPNAANIADGGVDAAAALNAANRVTGGVDAAAAPNAANRVTGGVDAAAAPPRRTLQMAALTPPPRRTRRTVRPAGLTPPPPPPCGGPCFARTARGRGRPLAPARFARLIARMRPHARDGRRTHPSPLLPRGLFSHRHNPKRPPDHRFLPPHLRCGDADFNFFLGIYSN